MIITNQSKKEIHSVEEWFELAPPAQGERHWKDGRSAKELAKAWMTRNGPKMPTALANILESHHDTSNFVPEWAIPEFETKLDKLKGSGRNHDMIVVGVASGMKTLIAIEAKVDEPFGESISDYMSNSVKRNSRSQVPERIRNLSKALFGSNNVDTLRYQLLHAIAGTLIEARNQAATKAIFIVHEFIPFSKVSKKAKQNEESLRAFLELLAGIPLTTGQLVGPITVPGGGNVPNDIPLYVGKVETKIGMN